MTDNEHPYPTQDVQHPFLNVSVMPKQIHSRCFLENCSTRGSTEPPLHALADKTTPTRTENLEELLRFSWEQKDEEMDVPISLSGRELRLARKPEHRKTASLQAVRARFLQALEDRFGPSAASEAIKIFPDSAELTSRQIQMMSALADSNSRRRSTR